MKMKRHALSTLLALCALALLLCASMTLTAGAATPGTLTLDLTWSGVDVGTPGLSNGDPVNAGSAALLEDGAQVMVGGQYLVPISAGQVSFTYPFDPGKTYTVEIQEQTAAPYYQVATVFLTPTQINDAIATGVVIPETVTWVEWSKPIKVTVETVGGFPAPVGTEVTIMASELATHQTFEVTKKTNADGLAVFYDYSYDPSDADMCNIYKDQVFVTAKCGDTTFSEFFPLTSNEITLTWPDVTVSGRVVDADGNPKANHTVATYYNAPSLYEDIMLLDYVSDPTIGSTATGRPSNYQYIYFYKMGSAYCTTTDASGNYTLTLPQGWPAEICVVDPLLRLSGKTQYWFSNRDFAEKASNLFPWFREWFNYKYSYEYKGKEPGLGCVESSPVTCTPYYPLTGKDLVLGRTQYTLKANIQALGAPYSGSITLSAVSTSGPTGAHKGGLKDRSLAGYAVTGGAVNKTDVRLAPGKYRLSASLGSLAGTYSGFQAIEVELPDADVAAGLVDLGTIDLIPIPYVPHPVVPGGSGSGGSITIPPVPVRPPADPDPGYGYVVTRMEAVADPVYPGNSYQITLNYVGYHTNAAVNQVASGTVSVELPAGVTLNSSSGMVLSGSTLSKSFTNIPTSEIQTEVFSVRIQDSAPQSYFILTCESTPNSSGGTSPEFSSFVTLQRLKINLSVPRLVLPSTKFTAFGDVTGAGENGIELYNGSLKMATGAKKGRYYYFTVPGQKPGTYFLTAVTDRDGVTESSNTAEVEVAAGLPQVVDAQIETGITTVPINPKFGMIYYTTFVARHNLAVPGFDVTVTLSGVSAGDPVAVTFMGKTFAATNVGGNQWKATVTGCYGYGDYELGLDIKPAGSPTVSTQIGRVLLMF